MLSSVVAVASECGYEQMSVARIVSRAGVSRRTFYDVFSDREDCFLAAFENTACEVRERIAQAAARERGWSARVRAGLVALLAFLDEEPRLASLLIVDALRAGSRVLERRGELLTELAAALDAGHPGSGGLPPELSDLTGEGVVGAVFSVIHTRISARRRGMLLELTNLLMGTIVLPYRGAAAVRRELERPLPERASALPAAARQAALGNGALSHDLLAGLHMRVTYRTLRVLSAIGDKPGASNRMVADAAGVVDPGQMSKLLARLQQRGLLENGGPSHQPRGEPNSWRLTDLGAEVCQFVRLESGRVFEVEE